MNEVNNRLAQQTRGIRCAKQGDGSVIDIQHPPLPVHQHRLRRQLHQGSVPCLAVFQRQLHQLLFGNILGNTLRPQRLALFRIDQRRFLANPTHSTLHQNAVLLIKRGSFEGCAPSQIQPPAIIVMDEVFVARIAESTALRQAKNAHHLVRQTHRVSGYIAHPTAHHGHRLRTLQFCLRGL